MTDDSKQIVIFYSWQSDLPNLSNRQAIKEALRTAQTSVEKTLNHLQISITLDEATRNLPGSPNIPKEIMNKIEAADIFVADVSIINSDTHDKRKHPNPNVVFELGYAVAHLGWNRVIMLFNTKFGEMRDLPFDFDRHRASPYMLDQNSKNSDNNKLVELLNTAIQSIITANPNRPAIIKSISPKELQRARDIENIKWALTALHIPTLDQHFKQSPRCLEDKALYFFEQFNFIADNSLFHLYDKELEDAFRCLHHAWDVSTAFFSYYQPNPTGSFHIFSNPGDGMLSKNQQEAWDEIERSNTVMRDSLKKILALVRENYIEIDIVESTRLAWSEYCKTYANT